MKCPIVGIATDGAHSTKERLKIIVICIMAWVCNYKTPKFNSLEVLCSINAN